jgi:hypothetical protein
LINDGGSETCGSRERKGQRYRACSPASCGHRPVRPARRNCLRG